MLNEYKEKKHIEFDKKFGPVSFTPEQIQMLIASNNVRETDYTIKDSREVGQFISDLIDECEKLQEVEIITLSDHVPEYDNVGYSDLVRFGNKYYRTADAEGYASSLNEINEKDFERLKKYKYINKE